MVRSLTLPSHFDESHQYHYQHKGLKTPKTTEHNYKLPWPEVFLILQLKFITTPVRITQYSIAHLGSFETVVESASTEG